MNSTMQIVLGWGSVGLLTVAITWRLLGARLLSRFEMTPIALELIALVGLLAYGRSTGEVLVSFAALILCIGSVAQLLAIARRRHAQLTVVRSDPRVVRLRVLSTVLDDGSRRPLRR